MLNQFPLGKTDALGLCHIEILNLGLICGSLARALTQVGGFDFCSDVGKKQCPNLSLILGVYFPKEVWGLKMLISLSEAHVLSCLCIIIVRNPFISNMYGYQPYSVMQKSTYLFYDNCG